METILCAAIWFKNEFKYHGHHPVNIDKGFVLTGFRHTNCFTILSIMYHNSSKQDYIAIKNNSVQGFLTNKNRFVDRSEAMSIATKAKQLLITDINIGTVLFSEDIY